MTLANVNQEILQVCTKQTPTRFHDNPVLCYFIAPLSVLPWWRRVSRAHENHWAKHSVSKIPALWNPNQSKQPWEKHWHAEAGCCKLEKQAALFVWWPGLSRRGSLCPIFELYRSICWRQTKLRCFFCNAVVCKISPASSMLLNKMVSVQKQGAFCLFLSVILFP